jgi:hypothetical protein
LEIYLKDPFNILTLPLNRVCAIDLEYQSKFIMEQSVGCEHGASTEAKHWEDLGPYEKSVIDSVKSEMNLLPKQND